MPNPLMSELTLPVDNNGTLSNVTFDVKDADARRNKVSLDAMGNDETGNTKASKPYFVGDYIYQNDKLLRVTQEMKKNDSITPDTNCKYTNIAIELSRLDRPTTLYAFRINGSESDPKNRVTYLEDCSGYTPAYMDFTNNVFRYGSWGDDEFFMPKACMLAKDGTLDYYLSPYDYTKKINGSASDIANAAYEGNAMLEYGREGKKIYYKLVPDTNDSSSFTVYISDGQVNEDFKCWSFIDNQDILVPHFYTSIYNGSVINGVMRSLSGQQVSNKTTGTQERTYARANNPGTDRHWDIECFADWQLNEFLTWLIFKSTDSQTALGKGLSEAGSESINNAFRTGVHNDKGLFYGTNSGAAATYTNGIKLFGKENAYGFQWRRLNGWCMKNGDQRIKFTKGIVDGSVATDYNDDGTDYISIGATPGGSSGGYVNIEYANEKAVVPKTVSGASNTHYCDGLWFNNNHAAILALVGGGSDTRARVGVSFVHLGTAVSGAAWGLGASLSYK